MDKKSARIRRAAKTRAIIKGLGIDRLTVFRTPRHIYAQIQTADGAKVIAASSTVESGLKSSLKNTGNVLAAKEVGKLVAERALAAGIKQVAFDRSGFKYHGRVKAVAEAAREAGLQF